MAKQTPKLKAQTAVQSANPDTASTVTDEAVAANKASAKPDKPAVASDSLKAAPKKSKKPKKASDKPNIFKRMWKGMKGIFSELKKVTWPKNKDVIKATAVVLSVVFVFFIILFGIDYVLAGLLNLIVNKKWSTLFIGS